jgi:hypothetical protein
MAMTTEAPGHVGLPTRTKLLIEHLATLADVPGDVIEFGVCEGENLIPLGKWMDTNRPTSLLWGLDWWRGAPEAGPEDGDGLGAGDLKADRWAVKEAIWAAGLDNVGLINGRVEDRLPAVARVHREPYALAFIDLDRYAPTRFAWEWVSSRMAPGGIVAFHDYQFDLCPGVTKLVDEAVLTDPRYEPVEPTRHNCLFVRRRRES